MLPQPEGLWAEVVRTVMVSLCGIILFVDRHSRTLQLIFNKAAGIPWTDIEKMLRHFGTELSAGRGSRVRIALNGVRAVFHRPHPNKETDRGAVAAMKRFLIEAGIRPEEK